MVPTDQIRFNISKPYTLGVELEFQLLDPATLDLTPAAPAILAQVGPDKRNRIKPEFIQSMLEINTDICSSVAEVADDLTELFHLTEKFAAKAGCLLYAASLHPFAASAAQLTTSDARYINILDELQLVGRRFITQGLHVHVGMPDGETAIKVCDQIRIYLPVFLALTTSSPFFEGQDTGLCSYRAKLFEALPLAGMPDYLGDLQGFQKVVSMLLRAGIIKQVRDLWWDVRPHPDFGTVEIRICDLPSRFDEILAIVALIQSTVMTLAQNSVTTPPNMQILRSNKWQAARHGLRGRFVDPFAIQGASLADAVNHLLGVVSQAADRLGSQSFLAPLQRILELGTSADRQRLIYRTNPDFKKMVETMRMEFRL
jgi:carboxylate-amine ligase